MGKKNNSPKVPVPPKAKKTVEPVEPAVVAGSDGKEEVTLIERCMYAGNEKTKGDKLTVTKAQADHLRSRKLIK